MSTSEYDNLFPFLDNIYVRKEEYKGKKATVEYKRCRLWRKEALPSKVSTKDRKRSREAEKPVGCPCQLKIVRSFGSPNIVDIIRYSPEGHNHPYELLKRKIPSGVKRIAAAEMSKGYEAADVSKNLQDYRSGNKDATRPCWRRASYYPICI